MFGQGTVIIGTWTQKARSRVFSGINTTHKNNSWFLALFGKCGQDWGRNSIDGLAYQTTLSHFYINSDLASSLPDGSTPVYPKEEHVSLWVTQGVHMKDGFSQSQIMPGRGNSYVGGPPFGQEEESYIYKCVP